MRALARRAACELVLPDLRTTVSAVGPDRLAGDLVAVTPHSTTPADGNLSTAENSGARGQTRRDTAQEPWWLTLLRLLLAALVILALADPVLNPREKTAGEGTALAIVLDNGWASAPDWEERVATASRLIEDARANEQPVVLALTAEEQNQEIGPFDADTALERLNAAQPRPVPANRPAIFGRVAGVLSDFPGAAIAVLSDGLAMSGDEAAFAELFSGGPAEVLWLNRNGFRCLPQPMRRTWRKPSK